MAPADSRTSATIQAGRALMLTVGPPRHSVAPAGNLLSVARLAHGAPWLCGPASRRGCLSREEAVFSKVPARGVGAPPRGLDLSAPRLDIRAVTTLPADGAPPHVPGHARLRAGADAAGPA